MKIRYTPANPSFSIYIARTCLPDDNSLCLEQTWSANDHLLITKEQFVKHVFAHNRLL